MKAEKKKIVIVFNSLNIGGIETKILDLCQYYSEKKEFQIYLLLKNNFGALKQFLPSNVKLISPKLTDKLKLKTALFSFWLALKFSQIKPDIVLSFGNYSAINSILAKLLAIKKFPIIISEDSSIDLQFASESFPELRKKLVGFTYPLAQKIIVLTDTGREKLLNFNINPRRITIKKNWLPLFFLKTKPKTSQNRSIDILFLGRFEKQKNPLKFLKIIKSILKDKPNLQVTMVGYGSLFSKVEHYIQKNQLQNNVTLHSPTVKPLNYYLQSKLLLLTSKHEGFPLTVLEATAAGCLPVCSTLPELTSYFDYKPESLLFDSFSKATFLTKTLLDDDKLRNKLVDYYQQLAFANQNQNFQDLIFEINSFL